MSLRDECGKERTENDGQERYLGMPYSILVLDRIKFGQMRGRVAAVREAFREVGPRGLPARPIARRFLHTNTSYTWCRLWNVSGLENGSFSVPPSLRRLEGWYP